MGKSICMKIIIERRLIYSIYLLIMVLCWLYCHPSLGLIIDVIFDSILLTVVSYAIVISDKLSLAKDWKKILMDIPLGYIKYVPYLLTIGFVSI